MDSAQDDTVPDDTVRDGNADRRTADAYREAVGLADALLALARVDEQLHRRLVSVAGSLRAVWEERVGDEALYAAHRHLEELVQIVCRGVPAVPAGTPGDGVAAAAVPAVGPVHAADGRDEHDDRHDKETDAQKADLTNGTADEPAEEQKAEQKAELTDEPTDETIDRQSDDLTDGRTDEQTEDRDDEQTTGRSDQQDDGRTDDHTDGQSDHRNDAQLLVRQGLEDEIHRRWPSATGQSGFQYELQNLDPQTAQKRCAAADYVGLARGLRLDALRLTVSDSDALHRVLAEALGTAAPQPGTRLPAFGDVLGDVPAGTPTTAPGTGADLDRLWAQLVELVGVGDGGSGQRPPYVAPARQPALCTVVAHALDLVAVVRESLLVPHSGLVRMTGLSNTSVLDRTAADNWERSIRSWVVELGSRHSKQRTTVSEQAGFVRTLVALDHDLAQIVPDPIPSRGSWWYDRRTLLRNQVNILVGAEGGGAPATYDRYLNKDITAIAETRALPRRDPYRVLWWLELPYQAPAAGGKEPLRKGKAICSDRQSTTAGPGEY